METNTSHAQQHLENYYQRRAKEYENIYDKPERQQDLKALHKQLQNFCKNKNILEIACGTGYWTESISKTAASIHALDVNNAVLEIAEQKNYGSTPVKVEEGNAFDLRHINSQSIDIIFMGFWWSHVPYEKIEGFLEHLAEHFPPNATLLILDNRYVEGSSTPISRTDKFGNSFQQRQLKDGSRYKVIKNFPDERQIRKSCANYCQRGSYKALEFFWVYETELKRREV